MEIEIKDKIKEKLGEMDGFEDVGGGDINQAAKVKARDASYFVKWREGRVPGMYRAEAAGLEALGRVGVVRVPKVVLVDEEFLVLEWLDLVASSKYQVLSERKLGESLAGLHRNAGEKFGLPTDNFIGSLPQRNDEKESWSTFWWECRLLPQLEVARNRMKNEEYGIKNIEQKLWKLKGKLSDLIPNKVPVSLLHGDLWGGNWSVLRSGDPVIYDPAVYFGDREVDIAMTRLFGGFGRRFYEAYESEWELDVGWEDRVEIYQLYPLLVHWNLFGGSYGMKVEEVCRKYVG